MRKIKEVIVVEGRYDKNTLRQTVDAAVFPVDGFAVFNDRASWRSCAALPGSVG